MKFLSIFVSIEQINTEKDETYICKMISHYNMCVITLLQCMRYPILQQYQLAHTLPCTMLQLCCFKIQSHHITEHLNQSCYFIKYNTTRELAIDLLLYQGEKFLVSRNYIPTFTYRYV